MSTINQEPNFGAPQTPIGASMVGGMPATPGMPNIGGQAPQVGQMAAQQAQQAPAQQGPTPEQIAAYQAQQAQQIQQAHQAQGPTPEQMAAYQAQQAQAQAGQTNPLTIPGQAPAQQLPTIPDNNPVAEIPAGVPQQNFNMPQQMPAQMPGIDPNAAAMAQQYAQQAVPQQQQQYNPAMYQAPAQQQAPVGYNPQMQQQQAPVGYNPRMQQQMPGGMQQYQQPMAQGGYQAPGASNNSYLQNQGGMFGPTPTGHPEKTKFQGQAILVHVTNRVTSKGNLMTTGLFNPNPGDRNGTAKSFVCFSGSAANQIEILNNPMIKPQYTNLPQAKGQSIWFEGSWEWDTKAKTPGWKCMMDNFVFVNDQDLRTKAEAYVPPVPPSPMDMLNGGNMAMGNMMQQQPMQNVPGMQQPAGMGMPQQQYNPQMQQAPVGYNPQAPQPTPGYPGMVGMQQQAPAGYPTQQAPQPMPGYPGVSGYPGMPGHQ